MQNPSKIILAALVTATLTTPIALAEKANKAPTLAVEKTDKFATQSGTVCTLTRAKTDASCGDQTLQESTYPKAPIYPQFGI